MALTFLFNGLINRDIEVCIKSYLLISKLHYYPCCCIEWIETMINGNKLSSLLQQYKITIKNQENIIFHGELYDILINYQDFTGFYRPGFNSLKQIYDIFNEDQLFQYKYKAKNSQYSYFSGEELLTKEICWDPHIISQQFFNELPGNLILHKEIKKKIPTNINVVINTSYSSILPLKISTGNYFPFIFCQEQENLEEVIEEALNEHNDHNIYKESFCLIPQGIKEGKMEKYYFNIDYINTVKCQFEESLTIQIKEPNSLVSKEIIINQKLPQIQMQSTKLTANLLIKSQINTQEINDFFHTYFKKREFQYRVKIVINIENIQLQSGDIIRFNEGENMYCGIVNQIIIKSLPEFPNKTFGILDCECFILEDNSSLVAFPEEQYINNIQYPKFCTINLSKAQENWQKRFNINFAQEGKMQIRLPKISHINQKIHHPPITID